MTQWLPIDTYPVEENPWGLFRGGQIEYAHRHDDGIDFPAVVGCDGYWDKDGSFCVTLSEYDNCVYVEYHDATEWLPLSVLDMLEDHHVTAARLLL